VSILIERMQHSDLDEVMRIEKVSFQFPWKRSFFAADLNRPTSTLLVARDHGALAGYAVIWRTEDELHLANVAVAPGTRHQGIGTQILQFLFELGAELQCTRVYLEVRPSNFAAVAFYKKHGFFHTYTRERYYPDGEDALVFERDL
jgi:ribosomal-protein-alanine acetyltransferase